MRMRLVAALCLTAGLAAQPRAPIEVAKLGPQVGETVPGFSLRDQHNALQTLQSVMGTRGAMIFFIRSADW